MPALFVHLFCRKDGHSVQSGQFVVFLVRSPIRFVDIATCCGQQDKSVKLSEIQHGIIVAEELPYSGPPSCVLVPSSRDN